MITLSERNRTVTPGSSVGGTGGKTGSSILVMLLVCWAAGCIAPQTVKCPISDSELNKQILAIVPVGTPRDEAVKKLAKAGIQGAFGSKKLQVGQDYYCCQSWLRPNGEEWKLSLLLRFDKDGKLVETLELPDLSTNAARRAKA